ncbi:MAG: ThiF family adenylyltransferase [Phycisphaerales bacterium JB050]
MPDQSPSSKSNPLVGRYQRQTLLCDIGDSGQSALAASRVVILGCGALGTVLSELLTRAGVGLKDSRGWIRLIDRDIVEPSNLQRQTLFTEADALQARPKAVAAADALARINSSVDLRPQVADFNHLTAARLASCEPGDERPHVLLDGTDNFSTRLLLNDLAVREVIPMVYAGAVGTRGMLMSVLPPKDGAPWESGPCLRCLLDEPPAPGTAPTCDSAGVLGTVTSATASFAATEAIKILIGRFDLLRRHLLAFDPWNTQFSRIDAGPDSRVPDCPCCAQHRFEYLETEAPVAPASLCGRGAIQVAPPKPGLKVDLQSVARTLAPAATDDLSASPYLVRASLREPEGVQITVFADGRALFQGLEDTDRARALYSRLLGG